MFTIYLDLDVLAAASLDALKPQNPFVTNATSFLKYFGKTTYQTVFLDLEEEQDIDKLNLLIQFQDGVNEKAPKFEVKKSDEIESVKRNLHDNIYTFLFLHQENFSYFKTHTLQNNHLVYNEINYLDFIKFYDFHKVVPIDKDLSNGEFKWDDLLPEFPTTEVIIIDDYILTEYETAKLKNNFYFLLKKLKTRYSRLRKIIVFTQGPWTQEEFKDKFRELITSCRAILGFSVSFILMSSSEKKEHDRFILANYFRVKLGTSNQFLGDNGKINNKNVSSINSDSYFDFRIADDAKIPLYFAKEKLAVKKQAGNVKDWVNSKLLNI